MIKKIKRIKHKNMKEITFLRETIKHVQYQLDVFSKPIRQTGKTLTQTAIFNKAICDYRILSLFIRRNMCISISRSDKNFRKEIQAVMSPVNIEYWKKTRQAIRINDRT